MDNIHCLFFDAQNSKYIMNKVELFINNNPSKKCGEVTRDNFFSIFFYVQSNTKDSKNSKVSL